MRIPKALCLLHLALAFTAVAKAQAPFPNHPVRIILPSVAGGPTDVVARRMAEKMSETLGQQVLVDNRPGANGTIGASELVRSKADGYTLMLGLSDTFINVNGTMKKVPYETLKDFSFITQAVSYNVALMVRPDHPANSIPQLIQWIKSREGKASYGSWGAGSYSHLIGQALSVHANTPMVNAYYGGSAPAVQDFLGGVTDIAFLSPGPAAAHARAGRAKLLAVTGQERSTATPDVPTFEEQGFKDPILTMLPWIGLTAPAGTPEEVVAQLQKAATQALRSPELGKSLAEIGMTPIAGTSIEFRKAVETQYPIVLQLIQSAGVVQQ